MFQFSDNLIEKTIKSYKEEDEVDVPKEEANEYLNDFAGLYLSFAKRQIKNPPEIGTGGY